MTGNAFLDTVPPSLSERKARMRALAQLRADQLQRAGAPVPGGLHVALDDGSRANMGAMATTALAAAAGHVPWPASYQTGWIAIENLRIALANPAAGLGLAALVGDFYAQIRQRCRDLKDLIEAAEDDEDLDGIDIESGWPS